MIIISASYTAELIKPFLEFYSDNLGMNDGVVFAPYNQIFQQLLDTNSLLAQNKDGTNIILIRFEDLIKQDIDDHELIKADIDNFLKVLSIFLSASQTSLILCLSPASEKFLQKTGLVELQNQFESEIKSSLLIYSNVHLVCSSDVNDCYPVKNYHDAQTDEIAHIPYTLEYFGALGTYLARKIHAIKRRPYKVIILDCDNTLWTGVCGEQSYSGIELEPERLMLQKFMIEQSKQGMLLCLCSKNNEEDVQVVFEKRKDMLLKPENIVTTRINWLRKSENIKSIAEELNLGLDSFIFVDDNPIECAEVQAVFPEVLCLTLPSSSKGIPDYLNHVWAFDHIKVTEEDKNRTLLYQQNIQREKLRIAAPTLADFISGLGLKVTIQPIQSDQITRVAQLSQRTNQFNFTTKRYTDAQLIDEIKNGVKCLVVDVSDRFGDYGLVGALFYRVVENRFEVINFLLSCRVLGKGVEHKIITELGGLAFQDKILSIRFLFSYSGKNQPALNFLEEVLKHKIIEREGMLSFDVSTEEAIKIQFFSVNSAEDVKQDKSTKVIKGHNDRIFLNELAQHYRTADEILLNVMPVKETTSSKGDQITDSLLLSLKGIWENVLKIKPISISDNFFDLGGDSFLAALILSKIWQQYNCKLDIVDFFQAQTISGLSELINHSKNKVSQKGITAIPVNLRNQAIPLSFAQERLWFLDQLNQDSSLYNMFAAYKLEGKINIAALKKAFLYFVETHESLRTSFILENGIPKQVVKPVELSRLVINEQDVFNITPEELQQKAKSEANTPFDLTTPPLIRISLFKASEETVYLFISMHHIISDGWSFNILCEQVSTIYKHYCSSDTRPILPAFSQYIDFTVWHRNFLENNILKNQLSYWQSQLQDTVQLELPIKRSGQGALSYEGRHVSFLIDSEITRELKNLTQKSHTTLYVSLLATFSVLLARYTSQDDIAIGSPISGRHYPGIEKTFGFFVNLIILRLKLIENPSFKDFLAHTKKVVEEAYSNQDVPFEEVVAALRPQRDSYRNPLVQVLFAFQNFLPNQLSLNDVTVNRVFGNNDSLSLTDFDSSKFDLTLFMQEKSNSLEGLIEFNSALFEEDTIKRLIEHFIILLRSIIKNPEMSVYQLPLMNESESQKILTSWNDTSVAYSSEKTIHQIFESQVNDYSTNIAVTFNDKIITYQELNNQANNLAIHLRSLRVKKGSVVAVCLKQEPEMIITLLAILKAGGAYVPIDENYPLDYILHILDDCNPVMILTDKKGVKLFFENSAQRFTKKLVLLDEIYNEIETCQFENLDNINSSDDPAYIIYTSGTTGKPKGALLTHKGVNRLVKNQNYIEILPTDIIAQASSPLFDASIFEIWGALLNGAQVVMFEKNIVISPDDFVSSLEKNKVSILWLTSSLFNLIASQNNEAFHTLKYLIIGGEPINPTIARSVLNSGKKPKYFLNGYGPTECATFSTTFTITTISEDATSIPIGKPINNTQVYVLDRFLNPVPMGIIGELYIAGPGLAKGYLNNEELTKNKFISNPFSSSSKLYKTGDLVRWLPDGNLDYIGRIDNQIKIRGYRIELEEIESQLKKHPDVELAVVTTEGQGHDKKIVAYIVPKNNFVNRKVLNAYLKKHVFNFMLPHAYIFLDHLPLLASGKINRKALPKLENKMLVCESYQSDTKTFGMLKKIIARLLNIDSSELDREDNFFDLGGYSLLVIKLLSEIKNTFDVNLQVRSILDSSTLSDIADLIDSHHGKGKKASAASDINTCAIRLKEGENDAPLFLIHPAGGTLFCYLDLVKNLAIRKACIGIQDPTIETGDLLFSNIPEMAAHYVQIITRIQAKGPYNLAGYSFGGMVAVEIAHQLIELNHSIGFIGLFDTWPVSITEPTVRESLKKRILEQYESTKNALLNQNISENKSWIDLNYHRMQNLGFSYIPPKIRAKISLFKAQELFGEFEIISEETNYWSSFSEFPVDIYPVPGNHDTMLLTPNVGRLGQIISSCVNNLHSEFLVKDIETEPQ